MIEKSALTPMMKQYNEIKSKHSDAILMFRLGDFYEMFLDDARIAAKELDLTLTSKPAGKNNRIPLAGIPYHAANGYIGRLIRKGYKVAICEQLEDPKKTKSLVKRDVIRIVTPGTVLDSGVMDNRDNNYIVSINSINDKDSARMKFGLAIADISTGEFLATDVGSIDDLENELARFQPKECLVSSETFESNNGFIKNLNIESSPVYTPIEPWRFDISTSTSALCEQFGLRTLEGFGITGSETFISAAGVIIYYLKKTQKTVLNHFHSITRYSIGEDMILDRATIRHLELVSNIREGGRAGTLLEILDKTSTSMGARLLKKRILEPLRNPDRISQRLEGVETFFNSSTIQKNLTELLKEVQDIERLTARISCKLATARDLNALSRSLKQIPGIKKILSDIKGGAIAILEKKLETLGDIIDLIDTSITDDPPPTLKEGNLIRPGKSTELDKMLENIRSSKEWIAKLQPKERERTGISSLKVGFNSVFGYYIELTKANLKQVPKDYIRKQTLANAERFITPELKEVESRVLGAQEKIYQLEFEIFCQVRDSISNESERLMIVAHILAEIDVSLGLARVAMEYQYKRPEIISEDAIEITEARHPVVERYLNGDPFIPNDLEMNSGSGLHIITGPNMAGKSTYIRQVALLILMAQIGSFVPAKKMRFKPVDRIFTRVGASDDIARGHSTFMVEMLETANILNNATSNSLIILDEIGRGTSTFDGLSIAWAIVEYIVKNFASSPFTLFATHYHELTSLAEKFSIVKNYNITIKEYRDKIIFLRKIAPGRADKSYGIQVARLAGMPDDVISRARDILTKLESGKNLTDSPPTKDTINQIPQMNLFETETHPVIKKLKELNIESLTPIEALNYLNELKKDIPIK